MPLAAGVAEGTVVVAAGVVIAVRVESQSQIAVNFIF